MLEASAQRERHEGVVGQRVVAPVRLAPGVQALASRAAWIEASRTLVIADVHLGKPETFAAVGVPMPRAMTRPLLQRMSDVASMMHAGRVLVVGDLLHARAGLTTLLIDEVAAWRREALRGVELLLVPGNHDRSHEKIAAAWDLVVCAPFYREQRVAFVHDPNDVDRAHVPAGELVLCGHVHPVVRAGGVRGSLRAACFVVETTPRGGTVVTLPAFTDFSSGASQRPAPGRRLIVALEDGLVEFPPAIVTT